MEAKLYQINSMFARENKIPVYFAGKVLRETVKAVYLYGRFTTETVAMNVCCVCGRTLTHPVSVKLGIGPECGNHYWDWDLVGGYSLENVERLKKELGTRMQEIVIDQWFPKSVIKQTLPTETVINIPADHKLLVAQNTNGNGTPTITGKVAKLVTYQNSGEPAIKIEFPFDRDLIDKIKTIPGRRYHGETAEKYWTSPVSIEALELLNSNGFLLTVALRDKLAASRVRLEDVKPVEIPGLNGTLFPFQEQGIAFLNAKNGRALIGDEMGLGKTVQAIGYLQLHPENNPAIIVVPASLKLNWAREIQKWMDPIPNIQILEGTNTNVPLVGEIIIINYDILASWVDALKKISPKVLITDECHYYKNNAAKRTKAVKALAKGIPHIIALSGTPIVNRPIEMYNAVQIIEPGLFPSFWVYAQRYCGARNNGFGWDFTGATNTEELNKKLTETIMLRRKKEDVLKDLPAKIRGFIPMELTNSRDYWQAERNFIEFVKQQKGEAAAERASNAQALAEIEGLKQLAVAGKLDAAIDWIRDFIDIDGKLVVFAVHKFVIDRLMEVFKDVAVKIDGSVSMNNRDAAVQAFQNDPKIRLFVGNIKAAGVGLTLTAASNVVFLELPWTPGDLDQAEDRCHRIGQKDSVNIHYLLAAGTIEEKIAKLIDRKRKVLDAVLDGKITDETSLLSELMEEYG